MKSVVFASLQMFYCKIYKCVNVISIIAIVFLCLSCFRNAKDNTKFSDAQIKQLDLKNVKSLEVISEGNIVLDINYFLSDREVLIQDLVENVKYVPLQTTNESLIAEINKIISTEQYFFILDSDTRGEVFIFSTNGDFIKKIPRGFGPEEIHSPLDIAIDEDQKHLIINNRKGLSIYDYQGNFVKREVLPFNFLNFRALPNGFLFVMLRNQNEHMGEVTNKQILITDKKFRIISAGFPFHYPESNNYEISDYTSSFGNIINFSFKFSNAIYQYIDTVSVREKYKLDFSKKALPKEYLESSKDIFKFLRNNDYYYYMGDFIENATHEYIAICNNYNRGAYKTFIFRDKQNGILKGGNKIVLKEDIPFFSFPITSYNNEFIGVVSTRNIYHYLSQKKKEGDKNFLFEELDSDSNPILMMYRLK